MTKTSKERVRVKITVRLNGTSENPWHIYGLRHNPFPQLGKYEFDRGEQAIRSLDGDPLTGPEDIRKRLKGKVTEELIELCIKQFIPGQRVIFDIFWEEPI